MKSYLFLIAILLLTSCEGKKESEESEKMVPVSTLSSIIDQLSPKPYDFSKHNVICVISPDRTHLYALESQKERIAEGLKAEMIDEWRWNIQLNQEKQTTVFVSYVSSPKDFGNAYPTILAGLAVGIPGLCKSGDDCVSRTTLATAECEKLADGSYVKNVISSAYCECDDTKEGLCFPIFANVGMQYFYGDDPTCGTSIGRGEIWKHMCFYD